MAPKDEKSPFFLLPCVRSHPIFGRFLKKKKRRSSLDLSFLFILRKTQNNCFGSKGVHKPPLKVKVFFSFFELRNK